MIFGGYTKIRNRKNKAEKIKNLPPKIFYYKFIVLGSRPFENFNQLCFVLVGFSFLIEIPYLNGLNLKKSDIQHSRLQLPNLHSEFSELYGIYQCD